MILLPQSAQELLNTKTHVEDFIKRTAKPPEVVETQGMVKQLLKVTYGRVPKRGRMLALFEPPEIVEIQGMVKQLLKVCWSFQTWSYAGSL
jgi:hypothetical protein